MVKLTKKERGFVKDYIRTENGTQSVLNNYDTDDENTAGVIAHENLRKPKIQKAIQEALPDELLAKVHLEGLDAKRDDIPDYAVRHKYLDSAYKIKGTYAPEKTVSMNIEVESSEEIKKLAEELNALHKRASVGSDGVISSTMGQEVQD